MKHFAEDDALCFQHAPFRMPTAAGTLDMLESVIAGPSRLHWPSAMRHRTIPCLNFQIDHGWRQTEGDRDTDASRPCN